MYVDWRCPQCGFTERTRPLPNRWHVCPRLKGISVQLVKAGVNARFLVKEREDYVGGEVVQLLGADSRPIMSVTTERDDGTDVVVYAPTATGGIS